MAGQYFFKVDDNFLPLSGGTVSGNTYVSANLSADTLSLVNTPNNDDSLTQILARNSANGDVEYRDVQSIISAATSQDTYVTGGTYNDVSNELSLERNDAVNIIISGFSSGAQFGTTYFVAPEGSDSTGEYGNISRPFKTITGARNQLLIDSLSGQTLIYVFPGTYDETELQYPNGKMYLSPGSLIKPSPKINGAGAAMTAVNQGTKTFTFNGNWSTYLIIGKRFRVVIGANSGTYTIVSAADVGGTTEIVVSETIPSSSVGGILRTNESIFLLGDTPINAPSGSTSNNFDLYGQGDVDVVKSLDNDWADTIVGIYGNAEFYGEATSWRQEKGILIFATDDTKVTFNGSNLELYGGSGYVASVRDSSDSTFNFDRISCNGSFGFFVRYNSNPTFNGSCVVTANVIKGTDSCQTLAIQRMGPGGRVVINSPIIETENWTLNTVQNSGGEAIINGNIFATTTNGKGIVTGLDSSGGKFTINGNITTDANTAFLGVGGVNSNWYFNGNIQSLSGSSTNPIMNFGSGSGSVNLNGSIKNTDGGTTLDGIKTNGVDIIIESLELVSDNETITASSPQTVEILNSLSINNPLNSNITTTGLYNYTGTTNVGDLVIYNTPTNDDSLTQILGRNSTTGNVEYRDVQSIISAATSQDTFVTGFTYDGSNKFTISDNSGSTFSTTINTVTGLTSNGNIEAVGNLIATGGTGNVLTKQVYLENNLGLDWDFPSSSVVLGNNSDGTIINGTSLTINSDTLVNGNVTGNSLNLSSITNDDSLTEILARNSSGLVEYRDVDSIIGAASADTYVVSGNADVATSQLTLTYNTGGTFTVTNSAALFADNDINVTGGTYNPTTGCVTFSTNSGTTFDVCGFVTGITDTYVTGGTYNSSTDTIDLTRTDSATVSITGVSDTFYWTTGSTGNYSIKALNDTAVDATGNYAVAEGSSTASGDYSHAEGGGTASGDYSHAEGGGTASGDYSHAEGGGTTASGRWSHSEGSGTIASADYSHAEGFQSYATGNTSHAEGFRTVAGDYSHSEGFETKALSYSHAEGLQTTASGDASHATGYASVASGLASWAGGQLSTASGDSSFIHSTNSLVTGDRSVVLGGQSLTGATDDTVYVPFLNINNLASGTSINNLGIDSSGNVVTGSADENDITRVQPGTNINTGGTANNPIVNLDDDILLNSVSGNTLSGGTIYSGSTDLYDIFLTENDGNDITRVQPGSNINTGGTANNPIVNLEDDILLSSVSATTLSGGTLYSGSTDLSDIFLTTADGNDITRVQNGINTFTGGTENNPTINVTALTIDNITVSGDSSFDSVSATTIYSGSTDLSDIFATKGEDSFSTGGTVTQKATSASTEVVIQIDGNNDFSSYNITGLTDTFVSGFNYSANTFTISQNDGNSFDAEVDTIDLSSVLSAVTFDIGTTGSISATTFYSGSTDLSDIFLTTADGNDITRVQGGINTFTGGTGNNPTVNVTGLTVDNISVSGISSFQSVSATTIYSGSTDLYDIFLTENDGNDITRVQGGINISTGGTANNPIVNLDDDISLSSVSATTLSGGTLYSGSTDLYDIFLTENVIWTTGSTGNFSLKTINDSGLDATGNYALAEGGGTIASGNYSHAEGFETTASSPEAHSEGYQTTASGEDSHAENLFTISSGDYSHAEGWSTTASGEDSHSEGFGTVASGADSHAEGLNNTASNTASHAEGFNTTSTSTASHSEGFDTLASSEAAHSEGYSSTASGLASHSEGFETTSSGLFSHAGGSGSIASGDTSFIHSTNSLATGARSAVLGGQNITGATDDTVYVPFLNINNLATGTSINNLGIDVDGNIVTGGDGNDITRVSGGTNISTGGTANNPIVNLDDDILLNSVSGNTLSGGTIYSGSTDLYDIFLTENDGNDITRVQGGTNISTGGTANNPIVNLDDDILLNSVSGNTLSGGTIYSGSTDLYDIFLTENDGNDITRVQGGTNISTGGTANNPIVNLDDDILLNSVSGNTLSGGTIYSGSTDLYDIFLTENDGNDITRVQGGTNISTGGTANNPIVNLDDDISLTSVSATTLSGGTLYSGSTDLTTIIENLDTYVTGGTFTASASTLTLDRQNGSVTITGLTSSDGTSNEIQITDNSGGFLASVIEQSGTHIIPTTDSVTNLGSPTNRFDNLYLDTIVNVDGGLNFYSNDAGTNLEFTIGTSLVTVASGNNFRIANGYMYFTGTDDRIGSTIANKVYLTNNQSSLRTGNLSEGYGFVMGNGVETAVTPDLSAIFKLESTTQGFLPPVMTGAEAEAISTPAEGLQVYASNAGSGDITSFGWWGYDGSNWVKGFSSGGTDTNTFVTGFTYNDNNTFTITDNDGGSFPATINQVSGLTVDGILSATTYTGLTLNSLDDVTTNIPTTPDATYQGELLYFDTVSNQWVSGDEYGNLGEVTIWGKKGSAGTIDKGCPVYIVGFDSDIHEVELANAATGTTMPVIGFTAEVFDNAGIYPIVTFGKITGLDTTSGSTIINPFTETWEVNDVLYMAKTDGGLTKFRPSGTNTQIQRVAKVLRIGVTNGQLFIFNTSRTAGLPNLTTDYLWVGNGNDTPQEAIKTDVGITVTGFTYNDNNILTITDDNGGSLSSTINQMSGLTVNGDLDVTGDTTLGPLTATSVTSNSAINVFNGHVNLRDNSYFLQGRTVADVNVSLIGVDNQDRVFVGNSGYDTYINSDTIVDGILSAQTAFLTTTPTLNPTGTDILVRNSSTGKVEYRPVSGITDGNDITRVQPGANTNTGGTANNPVVNLDDDISLNSVYGNTLSGGTIYSGSTDLYNIFATTGSSGEANTASNLGAGEGLFAQKNGVDLQFKSLTSTGTSLSISSDASTVNLERNNLVSVTSITGSSYSAITSDEIIGLDTTSLSPTLFLPDSTAAGKVRFEIKDIGVNARTNPITIQAVGSDTIITTSVVSSTQIFVDGGSIILVSTGSGQWWQM